METLKKTAAINLHKIRQWVKNNTTEEQRRQLEELNCRGTFCDKNYQYNWAINKKHIIYMGVGAGYVSAPVGDLNDTERKVVYTEEFDGFAYQPNPIFSLAYISAWPEIKCKIQGYLMKISEMQNFEA